MKDNMKNQTNNSLFTDIELGEAANVNGGNLVNIDWAAIYYDVYGVDASTSATAYLGANNQSSYSNNYSNPYEFAFRHLIDS